MTISILKIVTINKGIPLWKQKNALTVAYLSI